MEQYFVDILYMNENNPNRIVPFKILETTYKYHSKKSKSELESK